MDVIAGPMHEVLSNTRPGQTSSGGPSKVAYELDPALALRVSGQAADLLSSFPLTRPGPGLTRSPAGRPRGPAGLPCTIREAWEDNRK